MKNNLIKYILYPVVIYVVIFMAISIMIAIKMDTTTTLAWLISLAVTILALWYASSLAKPKDLVEALKIGIVWLLVTFVLDWFITKGFVPDYFSDSKIFISYGLTVIIPIIYSQLNKK